MQYQSFTQKELEIIKSLVNATLSMPVTIQITRTELFSLQSKLENNKMRADIVTGGVISVTEAVKFSPKENDKEFKEKLREPSSLETKVISQTLKGCIRGLSEDVK